MFLLLALLWLSAVPAVRAQTPLHPTPSRRYWEANPDSLRRVLDTQHADTARLRTLLHLHEMRGYRSDAELDKLDQELLPLLRRLRRPEAAAFRLERAGYQLAKAGNAPVRALDSLRAAVAVFDRLGWACPLTLSRVAVQLRKLNRPAAQRAYLQAKLAQYQSRGAPVNMAHCHRLLGYYFLNQGDYNHGIGHYLRSADVYRPFNRYNQASELETAGEAYAAWGNPAKALHYLRQGQAVEATLPQRPGYDANAGIYWGMVQAYRRLGNYPAALRHADLALAGNPADTTRSYAAGVPVIQAYGLALKSAVLLDMKRVAEARPLLARAQHLVDSLHLGLFFSNQLELDATWARYYAARHEPARAEAAWLAAYRKACAGKGVPLRLAYLRALADFYARQGRTELAGRYARLGLALADSLSTQQGAFHVAGYEAERAERAQQARIQSLRLAQVQQAFRARRQRLLLWATLAGLAGLAGLGLVLWRANRQKQQANALLHQQKAEIQAQRDQTTRALTDLRATQAQLIQKEKMASLGELTAGIAHEIQNPLNFVNNFSEVSNELMGELEEAQAAGDGEEVAALAADVRQNLGKITQHGQRAAGIVKGMLEHSRTSTGERAPTDLNRLCEEYLHLAYQGLRAKDKSFNAELRIDLAPELPQVRVVSGDVGRVLLNLFSNAFYAVQQRQRTGEAGYRPTVSLATARVNGHVEIRVRDNGPGMSAAVQAKIFQPFFTTKPTGEGTGLGLSLSHDIIAQGHGGSLTVDSQEGQGTTIHLGLPVNGPS
ncbi:ATP-binding protein [Hymenobacter sedentarius]|uniref:ATP-binding protein n=1 Tax=Hymenobacter sedentarius TaxID=1411621 RepID=UPI001E655EE8|nr:ATP-binding protein [Hymenobacter sedentarius]